MKIVNMPKIVVLLASLLFVAACLPTSEDFQSQSPLLAALERKVGRIAYMGLDGNIYTINQAGEEQLAVTTDADLSGGDESRIYLFPTWAPNSELLAFMSASPSGSTAIYTADPIGEVVTEVYSHEAGAPIYLYWLPDSEHLSFINNTPAGTLLLQMVTADGQERQLLDTGNPYYWTWAPDGQQLLARVGSNEVGHLSFITPSPSLSSPSFEGTEGGKAVEEQLETRPTFFQSPAWSPDGNHILITAVVDEEDNALLLTDNRGQVQQSLVTLEAVSAAFAWAPDSQRIAYIASDTIRSQGVTGVLTVLDIENPVEPLVTTEDDRVIMFFWSPDGKKIAYFTAEPVTVQDENGEDRQVLGMGLKSLTVSSGEVETLLPIFQPTAELINIVPYFDQYHRSATIWSPDSQNVVVAAFTQDETPEVWVINASGNLQPRRIADGRLAFWSWE